MTLAKIICEAELLERTSGKVGDAPARLARLLAALAREMQKRKPKLGKLKVEINNWPANGAP